MLLLSHSKSCFYIFLALYCILSCFLRRLNCNHFNFICFFTKVILINMTIAFSLKRLVWFFYRFTTSKRTHLEKRRCTCAQLSPLLVSVTNSVLLVFYRFHISFFCFAHGIRSFLKSLVVTISV